jgi:preprotein translocase subunit YajC
MSVVLIYLAVLAVLFFVLIVVPQRRQLSARKTLVSSLEPGDQIITAGGMYGTIRRIDEEQIDLEVADGVSIVIARQAVNSRVVPPDEIVATAEPENLHNAENTRAGADVELSATPGDETTD